MSKTKKVIVTLDDEHVGEVDKVASQCKAAGMSISDTLEFLGQITGEVDSSKEDALRRIPGVKSVDEAKDYQLPPPDSDVQ